jgi:hypothetical protein
MLPAHTGATVHLDDKAPFTCVTSHWPVAGWPVAGSAPPHSARRDYAGAFPSSNVGVCITADADIPE